MSKPLLSTATVDALTEELYGLSDGPLVEEADAVAADFVVWLKDKFDLTADQVTYVDLYPPKVRKFYGYLFASAFLTRGTINFPAIPAQPTTRRIKETRANLFGQVSYNDNDKELDGAPEINIEFTLL